MPQTFIEHGPELFRFTSFEQWVNKASSWFRGYGVTSDGVLCIDARGLVCVVGAHFTEARHESAYPIVVYLARPQFVAGNDPKRRDPLTICKSAADAVVEAYRKHDAALADYFAEYGAEHADDDCPQDDACDCPLLVAMNETEAALRLAVQEYRDLTRN